MDSSAATGRPLVLRYLAVLIAYLAVVWLLWLVGIEAIYQHPTPFYALFRPIIPPFAGFSAATLIHHALVAILATSAFALLAWGLRKSNWLDTEPDRRATTWFLVAILIFAFTFAAAVAMLRGGAHGIAQGYERPGLEYMYDIGAGGSIPGLFRDYDKIHEHLSAHSRVHPPGPIALLWAMTFVVGRDALPLALATMVFGALAILPLYGWVRDLFGPRTALTAAMLYALVPSIVLFTATSADIAFTPFTIATLFLFTRAIDRPSIPYAAAAGLTYALMSLLSFNLLGVGIYFAFEGLRRIIAHKQLRAVVQTAVVMFAAFLAVHFLLRLTTGFDYIHSLQLSLASFNKDQAMLDELTPRYPAWTWKFLNPAAWFFFAGIPVSLLFISRLRHPDPNAKSTFIVFALTLAALDILYMARGEGERSAMYILPFVVIPAAHLLNQRVEQFRSYSPLKVTLAFLAFQCWLVETLYYTYW